MISILWPPACVITSAERITLHFPALSHIKLDRSCARLISEYYPLDSGAKLLIKGRLTQFRCLCRYYRCLYRRLRLHEAVNNRVCNARIARKFTGASLYIFPVTLIPFLPIIFVISSQVFNEVLTWHFFAVRSQDRRKSFRAFRGRGMSFLKECD